MNLTDWLLLAILASIWVHGYILVYNTKTMVELMSRK